MNVLPQTEQALAELDASTSLMFGSHYAEGLKPGAGGLLIAERPYNPVTDNPLHINQFSMWADVTGEEQIGLYRPSLPLHINVVTHDRATPDADYLDIAKSRTRLADELVDALEDSVPGIGDLVYRYAVGEGAEADTVEDVEVIATDGNPQTDAAAVADICYQGLTFVISDFLKLPLAEQADNREAFPATVAVKTNHKFDLELPAGVGSLPSGVNGGEIDTDGPGLAKRATARMTGSEAHDELEEVNSELIQQHRDTVTRLRAAGIAVAHVIAKPRLPLGFDTGVADSEIAAAITGLNAQ